MKKGFILLFVLVAVLFVIGCTPEAKDKRSMQEIFVEIQEAPDEAVKDCDTLETENAQQACYGMYLTVKAQNEEPIDESICEKIIDPKVQEGCELYGMLTK